MRSGVLSFCGVDVNLRAEAACVRETGQHHRESLAVYFVHSQDEFYVEQIERRVEIRCSIFMTTTSDELSGSFGVKIPSQGDSRCGKRGLKVSVCRGL
jgi:hypothetical protein